MNFPKNLSELAQCLDLTENELCHFLYRTNLYIRKRKKAKPNGEHRIITEPIGKFKSILKVLDKKILRSVELHRLFFHKPKSSYLQMIRLHSKSRYILTADIDDFYPSVIPFQVTKSLVSLGINQNVAKLITRLTTLNFQLPQGFPTSPYLAAIILDPVLRRLEGLVKAQKFKVGLYADNLAISIDFDLIKFKNLITKIFKQNGFRLDKFQLMSKQDCQEIMNVIILRNNKLSVKKNYRDNLRKEIFMLSKNWGKLDKYSTTATLKSIKGKIGYISQVNYLQAKTIYNYALRLNLPVHL